MRWKTQDETIDCCVISEHSFLFLRSELILILCVQGGGHFDCLKDPRREEGIEKQI